MPHRNSRTEQYRPEHFGLHISMTKKKKLSSLNTISFRIGLVVSSADQSATDEDCRPIKVKAYNDELCNEAVETEFIL